MPPPNEPVVFRGLEASFVGLWRPDQNSPGGMAFYSHSLVRRGACGVHRAFAYADGAAIQRLDPASLGLSREDIKWPGRDVNVSEWVMVTHWRSFPDPSLLDLHYEEWAELPPTVRGTAEG